MWHSNVVAPEDGIRRVSLSCHNQAITYRQVVTAWQRDPLFRNYFNELLSQATFDRFRWETPPVTEANFDQEFEFVVLQCNALSQSVDSEAFAEHFDVDDEIVTFPNLGHDAMLVVPCPRTSRSCYGHLASFVRNAPASQLHEIWKVLSAGISN